MDDQKPHVNPWLGMWTRPHATVGSMIRVNPKASFIPLSFIYGFSMMLQFSQMLGLGDSMGLWGIIILSILLAIPLGMIAICFSSYFLMLIGKLIKGKATFIQMRCAVSWSNVAGLGAIVMWFLLIGTFDRTLFAAGFGTQTFSSMQTLVLLSTFILQLVFGIWGLVMLIQGISAAQGFSGWMALLNVILFGILLSILAYVGSWVLMHFLGSSTYACNQQLINDIIRGTVCNL